MDDHKVDLNTASVEELTALPGIGPTLARRIVQYRENVRPFEEPVEITAVSGISERTYQAIADRLTVTPPEPPSTTEAPPPGEAAEVAPPPEEPSPKARALPPREEPTEEKLPPPKQAPPPAQPTPSPERARAPSPPTSPSRARLSWLGAALLGGVLGMILTLLVLAVINGSLAVNRSRAMLEMENRVESLAAAVDSLQGETAGLRQRLDTLEGLTARMERAESAVNDLREETTTLVQQADALEREVEALSEDLAAIQSRAERVEAFFQRLQMLLGELFGEGTPESTPEPISPSTTPLPGQ